MKDRLLTLKEHWLVVLAVALMFVLTMCACESGSIHEAGAIQIDPNHPAREQARLDILSHGDYVLDNVPDIPVYGVISEWVRTDMNPSLPPAWRFYSERHGQYVQGYTDSTKIYLALDAYGEYAPGLAVHEYTHALLGANGYDMTPAWFPL